jgi:hypothetical protein
MTAPAQDTVTPQAPIQQDDAQYQVPSPTATPTPQGAPLPTSGQVQPQDSSVQTQQRQVSQNVGQPQNPQAAPAGTMPAQAPVPLTRVQKLLQTARHISEAMTPGGLTQTTIDPNTGETTRTQAPLTGRQIGLAIAMEAISGGLAGAGAHGPNATGQAAASGLAQGQKLAEAHAQQQAQVDQQAQTDLRTKQQVITNLLQTRQLAMTLGRQSLEDATASVQADAENWKEHQDDPTSILASGLTHDDAYKQLAQLGMGNAQVLITSAHPRRDPQTGAPLYQMPNGQIVPQGTPGSYSAPDFTYALVKPDSKVSPVGNDGYFKPQYKRAADRGFIMTNSDAKMPTGFTMTSAASQSALRGSQTADAVQADVDQSRRSLGLDPLNINADLKSDPSVRGAVTTYNAVLNQGGTHAQAMQAVVQSKYATAAGTINNWYGGRQNTDILDNQRVATDFDNGILYGHAPIVTRQDADRAVASTNPKVQAAGKAAYARMDAEAAQTKRFEAQATEGVHVAGEEQLEKFKANLAANGGGPDSPAANEQPNAQGVRPNYLASLPANQRGQVQAIGEGRQAPPARSKQGIALMDLVNTAYPTYNGANFQTYQAAKTKSTSGDTGKAITAANTAIDHVAEMVDNAGALSVLPGAGFAARKGVFGPKAQQQAQNFHVAQTAAAEEVNKAIKGGVLGVEEGNRALADISSWTPGEAKTKGIAMLHLLKDRVDEQQATLDRASVTGVAPFQLMTPKSQANFDRVTGNQTQGGSQSHPSANQSQQQTVPNGMIPARINGQVVGYKNPTTGQVTRF